MNAQDRRAALLQKWEPIWDARRIGDSSRDYRYDRDLRPGRVTLRRPFIFAAIVHVLAALPFVVVLHPRSTPPRAAHATSIQLLSLAAPPRARMTREQPAPTRNVITPPNARVLPKPDLSKGTPKVVNARPIKQKQPKPEPNRPKVGSADSTRVVRSELPAIGNMRGSLGMWSEGEALPYSYYFEVLEQKISSYWEPPAELGQAPGEVATIVWFRIEKDGRVSNRYIEEPSGSSFFDSSALRALDRAVPFPPLPAEFSGDHIIIHLRFLYTP